MYGVVLRARGGKRRRTVTTALQAIPKFNYIIYPRWLNLGDAAFRENGFVFVTSSVLFGGKRHVAARWQRHHTKVSALITRRLHLYIQKMVNSWRILNTVLQVRRNCIRNTYPTLLCITAVFLPGVWIYNINTRTAANNGTWRRVPADKSSYLAAFPTF